MNLEENEFVNKIFAIEDKFEILKLVAVDCFIMMFVVMIASTMIESLAGIWFIFCVPACAITLVGIEAGYFPVMNFRKVYMPSYSYEELDFINRCESRNPYVISNFIKYQHLFVE